MTRRSHWAFWLAWTKLATGAIFSTGWLIGIRPLPAPLQVVYGVEGETELTPHERTDLSGYRHSQPVRFGNHAYKQHQHDSLGYLADCILLHLEQGGDWRPEYWELVRRSGRFCERDLETARQQHLGIAGCPALSERQGDGLGCPRPRPQDRRKVGGAGNLGTGGAVRNEIHQDILKNGWSERLGAFRQRYEGENLDAAALLISVMDVLPPDDPRVTSTIEQIANRLTVNGFVYRFDPRRLRDGLRAHGRIEGAFSPALSGCRRPMRRPGNTPRRRQSWKTPRKLPAR